jgi:hypothetical protein
VLWPDSGKLEYLESACRKGLVCFLAMELDKLSMTTYHLLVLEACLDLPGIRQSVDWVVDQPQPDSPGLRNDIPIFHRDPEL